MDSNYSDLRDAQDDATQWVVEIPHLPKTATFTLRVYLNLWKEFYDWEGSYSQNALSGLASASVSLPNQLFAPDLGPSIHSADSDTAELFEIQDVVYGRATISCEPLVASEWKPYPRYTSCTPISSSIDLIGTPHLRARFAPFADDEDFSFLYYLKRFQDFGWQNDYPDPDIEMIEGELINRLSARHNFSLDEIDDLKDLLFLVRGTSTRSLLSHCSRRDYAWWPNSEGRKQLTKVVDSSLDTFDYVKKDLTLFCSNLNCIHSHCRIHRGIIPPFIPVKHNAGHRLKTTGEPCRNVCYRNVDSSEINLYSDYWDEATKSTFVGLMEFMSHASPCDLATICRMPCVEIYVEYCKVFPEEDEDIGPDAATEPTHPNSAIINFYEDDLSPYNTPPTLVKSCHHLGACSRVTGCSCFINKQRCTRSCRCAKTCELKFQGCGCGSKHKSRPCCVNESCLCVRLNRECDPEVCRKCESRKEKGSKCQNSHLQKQNFRPIQIKSSKYGLGAFSVGKIPEQVYIGEYVGEVFFQANSFSSYLTPLQKHVNLNYSFELTEDRTTKKDSRGTTLDSWNVGNETRYLNHADKSNCTSQTKYVNGTYKIVLSTLAKDIPAGKELTLDYGRKYWGL